MEKCCTCYFHETYFSFDLPFLEAVKAQVGACYGCEIIIWIWKKGNVSFKRPDLTPY